MAEAFELYASFKIDTSGYTQELNKIRQEMQQFQQELNSFAMHPTFDGGRFRAELQQAQQQSTQATEEIQRLQQQIQSLQQAADGGGSGDSGGGVLSGFLGQLDVIGDIASGQFIANMAVNGINSIIDGITGSIDESIGLASDLVETQNVVDVTFEDSASTINKWAQEALNAYGITETKAKQYSSTLGAMLNLWALPMTKCFKCLWTWRGWRRIWRRSTTSTTTRHSRKSAPEFPGKTSP